MRIYEIRHFCRNFLVYVNTLEDIKTLKKNGDFKPAATYRQDNRLIGMEFGFKCKSETLNGAKKYVERILNLSKKKNRS